jgi:PadR family transcriptional regulator PadR
MYGYELVREIESATKSVISLGEGVVYPVLHALAANGHLKATKKLISGRTRIYYTVTSAGKKRLSAMADDWSRISSAISRVLGSPYHVATDV